MTDFDEAIECFRRSYGVGCEEQTQDQIAEKIGIAKRCAEKSHYHHYSHFPGKEVVSQKKIFILEVLKQHHKADIWYGSI